MEPHTGPIRWGIAATGGIAAEFARAFARLDDGEDASIVAVGSRSRDNADAFAIEHGIERAHGSYGDLAADPGVDVVYVASIHPDHCATTIAMLEAGKHVLVEKPMALNVAEADRMIGAARRNDRCLMEAMWMRFNPTHVAAFEHIDRGDIGDLRRIYADFSFRLPPGSDDSRLVDIAKGGGALLDIGIYPLTLAWWAFGEPDVVHVVGHTHVGGADDEVSLLCGWDDGRSALLSCASAVNGTVAARLEGTEGSITLPAPLHATGAATMQIGFETTEIAAGEGSLRHQVYEVHRCIRTGLIESDRMPLSTTRAMLACMDGIRAQLGVVYPGE